MASHLSAEDDRRNASQDVPRVSFALRSTCWLGIAAIAAVTVVATASPTVIQSLVPPFLERLSRAGTSPAGSQRSGAQGPRELRGTSSEAPSVSDDMSFAGQARSMEEKCREQALAGGIFKLRERDFRKGTYRIKLPGVYKLMTDIEFYPSPQTNFFPPENSTEYPLRNGYHLGFFAAISIETSGVVIDLNGKTIRQSRAHHLLQRFFAVIELASRPFIAKVGPPQFGIVTEEINFATDAVIENGILGLSSHHGIHGNRNSRIFLKNLVIRDFEVGGISLNGAEELLIQNVTIGPTAGFSPSSQDALVVPQATLSQARFIEHFLFDLMGRTILRSADAIMMLRGRSRNVMGIARKLRRAIRAFVSSAALKDPTATCNSKKIERQDSKMCRWYKRYAVDDDGEWTKDWKAGQVFSNPWNLPDGSAVYGILLHKTLPAVHEFGACESGGKQDIKGAAFKNVIIRNVSVRQLKLRTDNVVVVSANGSTVRGPAGDVVQLLRAASCGGPRRLKYRAGGSCVSPSALERARYVGTVLSDAQIAFQVLRNHFAADSKMSSDDLFKYFGGVAVPPQIIDWAAAKKGKLSGLFTPGGLGPSRPAFTLSCNEDAMAHVNKGAVGLRLEFVDGVALSDVTVSDIENEGHELNPICALVHSLQQAYMLETVGETMLDDDMGYLGADARGIVTAVAKNINVGSHLKIVNIKSEHGAAYGADLREATGLLSLQMEVENVTGRLGSAEVMARPDPFGGNVYRLVKADVPF
ncbi:unnamed protein product [Polarella glacialis]|uniref:Uncharacterized protein n=1 Tax=Polarella glacialis TaxID=89957 RepID=A0A813HRJ5_POLGL|nr:unnamed protein product [Polarella glacialis]